MRLTFSDLLFKVIDNQSDISIDCGDKDLNDFFCNDAMKYQNELLSKTYYWTHNNDIIAMASVLNDKIHIGKEMQDKMFEAPLNMRYYPAVKIGRLGINKNYQSLGLGSSILYFLKAFFVVKNKTGCRFLTLDAYNNNRAINFYKTNEFQFVSSKDEGKNTRSMIFDLILFKNPLDAQEKLKEHVTKIITSTYY